MKDEYERLTTPNIKCGICGDRATWKKKFVDEQDIDMSSENDDNFICDFCIEIIQEVGDE